VTIALVIAISGTPGSGAAGAGAASSTPSSSTAVTAPRASAPEKCPDARKAVGFYRSHYLKHRARMGAGRPTTTPSRSTAACSQVRFLAYMWRSRAYVARVSADATLYFRKQRERTLRDFSFTPGNHAWPKAVREVQRVFPGTESWLLSCSAAEGGHGRWVGYSGVGYSTWLRDSDTVGGPLQFRFSTFTGMYRRGVDYAVGKGFRVPRMDMTTAWRSALGQAIAGGWARYTGNDNSHWSASWGRGC
jgi:hypothetical protein